MDNKLINWAKSIGYVPVTHTEEELAAFLKTKQFYTYRLTRSAVINREITTLEWLDKYNLLKTNEVVIAAAAQNVISMIKYCMDKGYNTSDCCYIAFLNEDFELLAWLKDNNCQCDKSQHYHGYDAILECKVNELSNNTQYEDLKRLYVSGFTEFPKDIIIHHINFEYPRDREFLLTYCSLSQINDPIKDLVKGNNNIIKLRLANRKVNYINSGGSLVVMC
jgi:hypothetical protein